VTECKHIHLKLFCFQLQNHEYFYSGVTIVLCIGLPAPNHLVILLPYVLEFHNNIVSWVQCRDMYQIMISGYHYTSSCW